MQKTLFSFDLRYPPHAAILLLPPGSFTCSPAGTPRVGSFPGPLLFVTRALPVIRSRYLTAVCGIRAEG